MKVAGLRCQRVLSAIHSNGISPASRISEEPDDGSLILDLGLLDHASDSQRVEDLPHRLRMVLGQDRDDRIADCRDVGLGAPDPFYGPGI